MSDEPEEAIERPELERMQRLLRERVGGGAAAEVARALSADEPFPSGARGARLLARAKAAIGAAEPTFATLIVRAIGEVIEVLAGDPRLGEVVAPSPVRGDAQGGVLVRQRLGEREIATHVDSHGDRFVVMLDFGSDAARRGTRVSLWRGEREVASEVLRQGRMLLPDLSEGTWRLQVRDSGGWVGGLDLVLTRRAA